MSKRIIIWLMAVAMIMGCLSFVSGEEPENTSGGAISGISETTYASEQIARTDIVDVSLPNDLPFDIVISTGTGDGVVMSSDFLITNNGALPVEVSVCDAYVTVANEDAFSVRSDKNLPAEGNNIYIDMICDANAESGHTVLGTEPGGENYKFTLKSGASDTFRFEGVVNEHGDMKWEDTTVTITLRFEMTIMDTETVSVPETAAISEEPAIPEESEEPAIPENAEETAPELTEETPDEENGSLPPGDAPVVPDPVAPETPAEQAETPETPSTEDAAAPPDTESGI
jgi:hypothetical protein